MSETGRQSATFLKLSWEHASGATQSFHTILHTSTKDCKNAASLDLGVANKSWWVGEFRNVNYKTSKVQTTFGEDCVRIWKPPRCPDAQLSSLRRVLSDFGDPRDCSPPGSSVHGFLQARFLEWVPSQGGLPDPGIEPTSLRSPALQADSLLAEPVASPGSGPWGWSQLTSGDSLLDCWACFAFYLVSKRNSTYEMCRRLKQSWESDRLTLSPLYV